MYQNYLSYRHGIYAFRGQVYFKFLVSTLIHQTRKDDRTYI